MSVNHFHDSKSYAVLVREDKLEDLAHIEPQLVGLLSQGYALARELREDDDPIEGWAPLTTFLDGTLRLSRSKHGLRSNQLTAALRGEHDKENPDAHMAPSYDKGGAWAQK